MGNSNIRNTKHASSWSASYGCEHYCDDTIIVQQKWKTVHITSEEYDIILQRMMKLASKV